PGTNAHLIVEEASQPAANDDERGVAGAQLLPLSARSAAALTALAGRYQDRLRAGEQIAGTRLDDICYTASLRRTHHDHRAAVVANSSTDMADALDAFVQGEARRGTSVGQLLPGRHASVVFVFCGQGPQWRGMGRQLLREEPVFRDAVLRCDEVIRNLAGWSPHDALLD